jgi:hypothetical protein
LSQIYKANPGQFAIERGAVDRAHAALESAKQAAAATIALRAKYTTMIQDAHQAGALSDWGKSKILERYTTEYATPSIDTSQTALDGAWTGFWNALKKADRKEV